MAIEFVPIRVNPQTRPSRLMTSIPQYIRSSGVTIVRTYAMYRPLRVFTLVGMFLVILGIIPGLRFMGFYFFGDPVGHVQSLILAAVLLIIGFQVLFIGLVADLISFNRKILEETIYRTRRAELLSSRPEHTNSSPSDSSPGTLPS